MLNTNTSRPTSEQRKGETAASKGVATDVLVSAISQALDRFKREGFSLSELLLACEVDFPGSVKQGETK